MSEVGLLVKWRLKNNVFSLMVVLSGRLAPVLCGFAASVAWAQGGSILAIQPYSTTQRVPLAGVAGALELVNLNTHTNTWYLLRIRDATNQIKYEYHLESPQLLAQRVTLHTDFGGGPVVVAQDQQNHKCHFIHKGIPGILIKKQAANRSYTAVCNGRLYLRQTIAGDQSTKEWMAELIRDEVWGGEALTTLVKDTLYKDKFLLEAKALNSQTADEGTAITGPAPAATAMARQDSTIVPENLGLGLATKAAGAPLLVGRWYQVKGEAAMYLSVLRPEDIAPQILDSYKQNVGPLDPIETSALVYLVAFDLSRFRAGFVLGTEHPRLAWSTRVPWSVPRNAPGPDGFDQALPLARTGLVPPVHQRMVAATFTGGFKRNHGAFRHDGLATTNNGHHYGFVENGVVFSKLQPHLATFIIDYDGQINLRTWTAQDTLANQRVLHARQNGYPLLDYDPKTKTGVPSVHVGAGLKGNWSADYRSIQRTLRSGACLARRADKSYLIYGYFSSVTAAAMARVFQAYGCRYGIHLDMNLLEHTYLAHYIRKPGSNNLQPEQLIAGMAAIDDRNAGRPRFLGIPDVRDFFYLMYR